VGPPASRIRQGRRAFDVRDELGQEGRGRGIDPDPRRLVRLVPAHPVVAIRLAGLEDGAELVSGAGKVGRGVADGSVAEFHPEAVGADPAALDVRGLLGMIGLAEDLAGVGRVGDVEQRPPGLA
jgi:hypothetical protein